MESVMLTWTPRNVVTITLMGVLVYLAMSLIAQLWLNKKATS